MREAIRRVERAAQVDSPVLIWGERGTGKTMAAELIHQQSGWAREPMVVMGTHSEASRLVEDALSGVGGAPREQGGASRSLSGSLLIEEITQLPSTLQARLLNMLEKRKKSHVTGDGQPGWNLRLIATSSQEPSQSVREGLLRKDLHYRLALEIHMPPLRERQEDLFALIQALLAAMGVDWDGSRDALHPQLAGFLKTYAWPGNVNQLRDYLQQVVQSEGLFSDQQCPLGHSAAADTWALNDGADHTSLGTLNNLERAAISRALQAHAGNRTKAAKTLGISVRTLQRKLRQWGW
jgi:DNA-binding NtrC family response regulator